MVILFSKSDLSEIVILTKELNTLSKYSADHHTSIRDLVEKIKNYILIEESLIDFLRKS